MPHHTIYSPDDPVLCWEFACRWHRTTFLAMLATHKVDNIHDAERVRRRLAQRICAAYPLVGIETWRQRKCVWCQLDRTDPQFHGWFTQVIQEEAG